MKERDFTRRTLGVFLSYYGPHGKLFAVDMLCAALISAVDLSFPMLTRFTIDRLLPGSQYRAFFVLAGCMVLMQVFRMACSWFVTCWGHTMGAYIEADMRRDLFNHLQKLPFSFYDNHRTGQIMSRVTNDLFEVTELAHHGPEDLFISLATLSGSLVLLAVIRREMALILAVIIPLMAAHIMLSRRRLIATSRRVKERTAEINASLESSISGARVSKAFTNEPFEEHKFSEGNRNFIGAKRKYYRAMAFFHSRLELMTHLLNVIVISAGGFLIMRGKMGLGDLIACTLFIAAFLQPIRRLQSFTEQFTTGMAGFSRFLEIMRIKPEVADREGAGDLGDVRGRIVYADAGFSYDNGVSVLEHIDLEIEPGTVTALVGPSGGGKTTLCHLLPRFYDLKSGSITIDGRDIRGLTLRSLRRNIGIVQQDVFLFAGTIRENIAYGRIDAGEEEIVEAAKRAEIHGDIMRLPDGYDTLVGERGMKLSGGQKQRVSIARIFLKNPPILILDEATSALDTATELRIQRALEELSRGRTTLVIAHRLSTIRGADRIVVIGDEGILEQGRHGELLARDGAYAELCRAQMSGNGEVLRA